MSDEELSSALVNFQTTWSVEWITLGLDQESMLRGLHMDSVLIYIQWWRGSMFAKKWPPEEQYETIDDSVAWI